MAPCRGLLGAQNTRFVAQDTGKNGKNKGAGLNPIDDPFNGIRDELRQVCSRGGRTSPDVHLRRGLRRYKSWPSHDSGQ